MSSFDYNEESGCLECGDARFCLSCGYCRHCKYGHGFCPESTEWTCTQCRLRHSEHCLSCGLCSKCCPCEGAEEESFCDDASGDRSEDENSIAHSSVPLSMSASTKPHTSSAGYAIQQAYALLLVCKGLAGEELDSVSYEGGGDVSSCAGGETTMYQLKSGSGAQKTSDPIQKQIMAFAKTPEAKYKLVLCMSEQERGQHEEKRRRNDPVEEALTSIKVAANYEDCRTFVHFVNAEDTFEKKDDYRRNLICGFSDLNRDNVETYTSARIQKELEALKTSYGVSSRDVQLNWDEAYRRVFVTGVSSFTSGNTFREKNEVLAKLDRTERRFAQVFEIEYCSPWSEFFEVIMVTLAGSLICGGDSYEVYRKIVALSLWELITTAVADRAHGHAKHFCLLDVKMHEGTLVMHEVREAVGKLVDKPLPDLDMTALEKCMESMSLDVGDPCHRAVVGFASRVEAIVQGDMGWDEKYKRLKSSIGKFFPKKLKTE